MDIMAVGAAGFAVASTDDSQVHIDDIMADKVVYLTQNVDMLDRLFDTPGKIQLFEKIVNQCGLEHLIALRGVFHDGTYTIYG